MTSYFAKETCSPNWAMEKEPSVLQQEIVLVLNAKEPYLTREYSIETCGATLCGQLLKPPKPDEKCTCRQRDHHRHRKNLCSIKAALMMCPVHRFALKTRYMFLLSVFGFSQSKVMKILSQYQLPNTQITNLDVWIKVVIDDIIKKVPENLLRKTFMQYYEDGVEKTNKPLILSSFPNAKTNLLVTHFKLTSFVAKSFLFY